MIRMIEGELREVSAGEWKRIRRRRWGQRLTRLLECLAMADPMTASAYIQAKERG